MLTIAPPGSSTRRFATSSDFGGAKMRWYTSVGRDGLLGVVVGGGGRGDSHTFC